MLNWMTIFAGNAWREQVRNSKGREYNGKKLHTIVSLVHFMIMNYGIYIRGLWICNMNFSGKLILNYQIINGNAYILVYT